MNELLVVNHISKTFGETQVLKEMSFKIERGELFSILGPNGAGKSTLISLILGLMPVDQGEIILANQKVGIHSKAQKDLLAVVFQNSILDPDLSVLDNLMIRAFFYTNQWHGAKQLAKEKLSDVKGLHLLEKRYGVLSGGEKRKVDIARALLNQPQLLFLDEPTTGLDIIARAEMWQLINELKAKYQMTVVLTTHYMEEARDSSRILMLAKGQSVAYDTPENLKQQYHCGTLEDVFLTIVRAEENGK